ncbi:MAG: PAS domain S-box protein [Anaerolineales bacterium]|nr:PAS domain S-box protein [Anaerolineales bacterium]
MKPITLLRVLAILMAVTQICFCPGVKAQGPVDNDVRFDRAIIDTGIQNTGTFIQDRDGFLWLGTTGGGLVRYDAYQKKVYKPGGPNSLPDTYIYALYEDSEGLIWIGTAGSGLVKYDKGANAFTQYRHNPNDPTSIGGDAWVLGSAVSITEDWDGLLWVGNTGGLNALDKQTGAFTRYQHDAHDPGSLSDDSVRSVFVDRAGVLWVGTANGLNRFDKQTGRFTRYVHNPNDPQSFGGMIVNSIVEDQDGLLWLATLESGMFSFDRATETFIRYAHNPDNQNSPSSDNIMQVHQDSAGMLWLAYSNAEHAGVSRFDKQTGTFTHYTHNPDDPSSLSSDVVTLVYEDRAGILWMINDTGVVDKLDNHKPKFNLYRHDPDDPNSLISDIVVAMHEDRSGMIWIGTAPGLQKYEKRTRTFTRYIEDTYFPGIYEDSSGTLWLGSSVPGGLHILDRETGQIIKSYTHEPADPTSLAPTVQVNMILEDRNAPNILWIATSDSGLEKFDKQAEIFTHYIHNANDPNSLGGNNVFTLYQDRAGYLWVPMIGGGLNRLDPQTDTITRYTHNTDDPASISADTVNVAFEDSAGALWVGTAAGFDKLDRTTGAFTHYNEETGFPVAAIGSINEDEKGNLWMGSLGGGGLIKFDPRTEALKVYKTSDGLQGDVFYPLNGIRDRDGEMWFGGSKGLNSFYPREIVDNSYIPPIAITALKQGGEELPLNVALERVQEITLDWRHNFFEFEYTALNFTNAEKNQYKYMLEGLDKEWFNAGTRRFGRYSGLSGGDYTLRIIGSNNDGVWNEKGVSIKVKVIPPWWETWWFYALVITGTLGTGILIYRSKSNQVKTIQAAALALQKSERNYREVFNATSDALFIHDETGRVLDVNDRMCAMFGYDRETALGLSLDDFGLGAPPHSQAKAEDWVRQAVQTGPQIFEWQSKHRNGETFWSEVALHACEIAGEKRVIASVRNITGRKQTEKALMETQEQMMHQERLAAVGQLAAGIAHDFNNILASIALYTQISLHTRGLSPTIRKRLKIIEEQADRAADLVQQILDFSRRSMIKRQPLAMDSFLEEVVNLLQRTLPESVQLELVIEPGDYIINADRTRVQQAIVNLALNARDAMPDGGKLRIALSRVEGKEINCVDCGRVAGGEWIQVEVRDSGAGIPLSALPHIFEPFFTTRAPLGHGLGLAQIYGIVKQHEGHIEVESEVSKGTTFRLYWPASPTTRVEANAPAWADTPRGEGQTILVVEDNATMRAALLEVLDMLGYKVLEAANGQEALEVCERHAGEIALVLSDWVMPSMGGLELVRELEARKIAIKTLMLTGHPLDEGAQAAAPESVAGWVMKPPNLGQLAQAVAQALGRA